MSLKVAALSDMHGHLEIDVPPCDLLAIAGDVCPYERGDTPLDQAIWLRDRFAPWLKAQPARHTVVVWGNHDWVGQRAPHLVPRIPGCHFLTDDGHQISYVKGPDLDETWRIWGTPWQPPFCDWAFNLPEEELARKWALIPARTDVLVCHGPPRGYGDLVPTQGLREGARLAPHELLTPEGLRVGSPSLLARILEIKPKLVVFGHIHPGFGVWEMGHPGGSKTILANVSVVDETYRLVRGPREFTL